MKLYIYFIFLASIILPNNRSIYSIGDTISYYDQNLEFNVCHSGQNYQVGESFSLSDYNGNVNGGNYKVFLISMNATW